MIIYIVKWHGGIKTFYSLTDILASFTDDQLNSMIWPIEKRIGKIKIGIEFPPVSRCREYGKEWSFDHSFFISITAFYFLLTFLHFFY